MEFLARELTRPGHPFRAAVFDFDGTVSMLRCGWEAVMEKIMEEELADAPIEAEARTSLIRRYIAESTGIQTIYQMEWLAGQVETLCGRKPLDPWEYKDRYNAALMAAIESRLAGLEAGGSRENWLVPGSREYLCLLKEAGVRIYIASGTDEEDVRREAALLGIAELAEEIHGAPHRRKDCSKEAVIREILRNGGLHGRELLVAGDGRVEIELGREVGALTIGIASRELRPGGGMNPEKRQKLRKAGADYLAADFRPLVAQWRADEEVGG